MGTETKSSVRHVLVAEDDSDLLYLMRERLEKNGFRITGVESGLVLLQMLKEGPPPDVLILDIKLPGRSGLELLPQIKESWPGTKILVYTSFHEKHHELLAILPYIDRLMKKMGDLSNLIQCVKDIAP